MNLSKEDMGVVVAHLYDAIINWRIRGIKFTTEDMVRLGKQYNITKRSILDIIAGMMRWDMINRLTAVASLGDRADALIDGTILGYYAFVAEDKTIRDIPQLGLVLKEARVTRSEEWYQKGHLVVAMTRESLISNIAATVQVKRADGDWRSNDEYSSGFADYVTAIARRLFVEFIDRGIQTNCQDVDQLIKRMQIIGAVDYNGYFVNFDNRKYLISFRDNIDIDELCDYQTRKAEYVLGPQHEECISERDFKAFTETMSDIGFVVAQNDISSSHMSFALGGVYPLRVTVQVIGLEEPFKPFMIKE
ncbi:hypothetical protein AVT69_gp298 [Pseudomonas phage PhiPA3]|uniref:Uncharacterized protein 300 n=1 Tax=Pseudomonas phage PhiPA3 TaxID=998086 RepID=F8SJD6_BPPA3|nr:hypothetical protein AVT69_gp298 [Pseudomonas phage PhiPA3]AEH03723.1 hypothetical protein [Pseudomonas phage PhiPA3]